MVEGGKNNTAEKGKNAGYQHSLLFFPYNDFKSIPGQCP